MLAEVEDPDVVVEELAGVLVGGADEDVEPALVAAAGEGGDDVVGLDPLRAIRTGTRNPSKTRRITGICGTRSSGIAARWAL